MNCKFEFPAIALLLYVSELGLTPNEDILNSYVFNSSIILCCIYVVDYLYREAYYY